MVFKWALIVFGGRGGPVRAHEVIVSCRPTGPARPSCWAALGRSRTVLVPAALVLLVVTPPWVLICEAQPKASRALKNEVRDVD
jgi:hypothetical protein